MDVERSAARPVADVRRAGPWADLQGGPRRRPASRPAAPRLGTSGDAELVRALESPNLWWRRTAQRLLVDRQSREAIAPLRANAATSVAAGRVHALWTLDGLGALDAASIGRAGGPDSGVRENAARLAEPRLRSSTSLASRLIALVDDPDARVRFVVLGALGLLSTPEAAAARRALLFAHVDDVWMQRAALSAGSDQAPALLRHGASQRSRGARDRVRLARRLRPPAGIDRRGTPENGRGASRRRRRVAARGAEASSWRAAALDGLAQGARGAAPPVGRWQVPGRPCWCCTRTPQPRCALVRSACCSSRDSADDATSRAAVRRAVATAEQETDAQRRADAIALAALDHPERRADWLARFVSPHEPDVVQVAAVTALGRIDAGALAAAGRASRQGEARLVSSAAIGQFLLSRWATFTPGIRSHAGDVLIADPARARLLVDAMAAGSVQPWSLGFWQKQDLVLHEEPAIRAAARAVLERIRAGAPTRCAATRPPSTSRASRRMARTCSPARARPAIGSATLPGRSRPGPRHGASSAADRACWPTSSFPAGRSPSTTRHMSSSAGREHGRRPPRRRNADDDHAAAGRRAGPRDSAGRDREDRRIAAEHDACRSRHGDLAGGDGRSARVHQAMT